MKRPQPDIGDILLKRYHGFIQSKYKLIRLWGEETIIDSNTNSPVVVMKGRHTYYPTPSNEGFKKLFKLLGMYEDVTTADYKGLKSAWIYFNKEKGRAAPVVAEEFIANNLNKVWWDETIIGKPMPEDAYIEASVKVSYEYEVANYRKVECSLLKNKTTSQRIGVFENNFDSLWNSYRVVHVGNSESVGGGRRYEIAVDDPWVQLLALYSLRSQSSDCTVLTVRKGYDKVRSNAYSKHMTRVNTYIADVKIPYKVFTEDSEIVVSIANDLKNFKDAFEGEAEKNERNTVRLVQTLIGERYKADGTGSINRPYTGWNTEVQNAEDVYDSLWAMYKQGYYSDPVYYLKKDVLVNPKAYGLSNKEVTGYVLKLIDSDYRKKKRKWYQKLFAVFVFLVVVVVVFTTGGATLPIVNAAIAVTAGSMALTLTSLLFSVAGADDWASAFSEMNKAIEPIVQIATVVTIVNSVQQALKEGLKNVAGNVAKDGFVKGLGASVKDGLQGLADTFISEVVGGGRDFLKARITNLSVGFTEKLISLYTLPDRIKLASLQERNKDLRAEYEDMTKENSQERDVLRNYMYVYPRPATADWSIYAEQFDSPYERGGGSLHIGNIQKTTKQAMRKADYSDPAFDNITLL